jgi:hypothetical protein
MYARTQHPRLVVAACRLYGVALWLYPIQLRREFRDELLLTFRNLAEDALATGKPLIALVFIVRIAADLLRSLTLDSVAPPPRLSMLGLAASDDEACGCLDRSVVDGSLLLAMLGIVLMFVGWCGYVIAQSAFVGRHSWSG